MRAAAARCSAWRAASVRVRPRITSFCVPCSSARASPAPMAAPQPRGAFLVFEGADRAGKSTQCAQLVEHLKGRGVDAELWRFPDRTTAIGQMINSYLTSQAEIDDAAVHLLFSANRWEKREELLRKLRGGTTLVVDRYAYSGVAFTAAKGAPGLDRAWCMAPDAGLPAPDAVFFLELSTEAAAARGGFGEERYEREDMQRKVLEQFKALRDSSWQVVDASQSIDALQQQLRTLAAGVVERCQQGSPLRTLWGEPTAKAQLPPGGAGVGGDATTIGAGW